MNTSTVLNVLKTNEQLSALPLRVVAGILFIAHGAQKLFAWFAGYGLEGTGQWMESIGLAPGLFNDTHGGKSRILQRDIFISRLTYSTNRCGTCFYCISGYFCSAAGFSEYMSNIELSFS